MKDNLKDVAMRHSEKGIVTWLRDKTYELLKNNAKEIRNGSDGDEIIVDESSQYVIGNGALYCGYFIISKKKVKEIDGVKLPEYGELHELY